MGRKFFLACSILLDAALVAVIIVIALSETAKKIAIIAPVFLLVVFAAAEIIVYRSWDKIRAADERNKARMKEKKGEERRTGASALPKVGKPIKTVQVIGTRTGAETRIFATYNFTVYSLMIIYEDETREVVECEADSAEFNRLLPYINK